MRMRPGIKWICANYNLNHIIHRRDDESMINVDISNVWSELTLQDLLGIEQAVFNAHAALGDGISAALSGDVICRIQETALTIREQSDIIVVTGIGAALWEARAAVELLQGAYENADGHRILFVGESMSILKWNAVKSMLEGQDVSVIAFSEAGTEEGASVLLGLKWVLERKYGTDECARRIISAASGHEGVLLAMAAAGIDIMAFTQGAGEAREAFNLRSFENPVWLYTAVRILMRRSGKAVELLSLWESDCASLGKWWQLLFLDGEDGLFPLPVEFPADLPTLEKCLVSEQKPFFETAVRFAPGKPSHGLDIYVSGLKNPDTLLDQLWWDTLEAHADCGVPIITVECGAPDAHALGWLSVFLELGSALSIRVQHSEATATGSAE